MFNNFDVSSDIESDKASKEVGKPPISLEDIPRDLMVSVSSFLTEVDASALSAVSKTIYYKLLQNDFPSTANRRARAIDYRLFSQGRLPLQDPITLPSLTLVNKVKPQFLPVMIVHNQNDEDSSFSKKKSLSLELLLSSEQAGFNTVNVLIRNLPTMVREIITIEAINHLPDSGEIKYAEAKLYLDIIIADRKTRLPLSALKKLILAIERLSEVTERYNLFFSVKEVAKKYKPLLCQAIADYIRVFDNSLENNMHSDSVSNDIDVINLFKKYNFDTREITAKALEDLMARMLLHKADASADALIVALEDSDESVVSTAIKKLTTIAKHISENKADAIVGKLISDRLRSYSISSVLLGVLGAIVARASDDKFNKIVSQFISLFEEPYTISRGQVAYAFYMVSLDVPKHRVDVIANVLIVALWNSSKKVRAEAVDALGKIAAHVSENKADTIVNATIAVLRDSDAEVRAKAATTLGKIAACVSPDKVNKIADALIIQRRDFDDEESRRVVEALSKVAAYVSPDKVEAITDVIIAVLRYLNVESGAAAKALGKIAAYVSENKAHVFVDELIDVLKDSKAYNVIKYVAKALVKITARVSPDKVNEIADALIIKLRDFDLHWHSVKALGKIPACVSPDKVNEIAEALIIRLRDFDDNFSCDVVEALVKIAARISPDKVNEIADVLMTALSETSLDTEESGYVIHALGKIAAHVSPDKVDAIVDVLIASLDERGFPAVIALEALIKKGVVLSEENAKLFIAEIKELDKFSIELIIVDLCDYFANFQTSVDTITLNQLDHPIQQCLLNGENLFYILRYLLNDKRVVAEGVTRLTPEAYGTFISKVIAGYQPEHDGHNKRHKGVSSELNDILQDTSGTSQQKMGAVVKHIWQEKNQSVFFGGVQHPSTISMIAQDTLQEMIQSSSSAI